MAMMNMMRSQVLSHATRRLNLKWEQLWKPDGRLRPGQFMRLRVIPSVGAVDKILRPKQQWRSMTAKLHRIRITISSSTNANLRNLRLSLLIHLSIRP
jgi:hypothetical protein